MSEESRTALFTILPFKAYSVSLDFKFFSRSVFLCKDDLLMIVSRQVRDKHTQKSFKKNNRQRREIKCHF